MRVEWKRCAEGLPEKETSDDKHWWVFGPWNADPLDYQIGVELAIWDDSGGWWIHDAFFSLDHDEAPTHYAPAELPEPPKEVANASTD